MSTLKTGNITHPSSTGTAITLDASDNVNFNSNAVTGIASINGGQIGGNRNLIINGAMTVAQRGNSTGVTATGYYGPDRFQFAESGRDQFQLSISQASDGPDGYSNSWKMETTTVETAVDATEYALCIQRMEGQNLQHLKYGTSSAQQLTASFWVKSSVTADFGIYLFSSDGTRIIGSTYTINSANTWEYKTVTFAGDTGGTLNDDNGDALYLGFVLAAGSDMSDTDNTSWGAYASGKLAYGHTANALLTTVNNTWQITGVQLEVGSQATPFEHRSYGDELARCQRYYYALTNDGTTTNYMVGGVETSTAAGLGGLAFPTSMRAVPTATLLGTNVTKFYSGATGTDDSVSIGANRCSSTIGSLYITGFTGGTVGQACSLYNGGSGSGISFDAEL